MLFLLSVLFALATIANAQQFLSVSNNQLRLNGEKVFLSGMNLAWHEFGNDFGNGRYDCCTGSTLENYLRRIRAEGGNSIRIWLHTDGRSTPRFDSNGYVLGTDASNTMINDLSKFLDVARANNILVIIVLWNGATTLTTNLLNLLWDDSKLQSYIDNALIPMVNALKGKVALGAWEIMNEPDGLVRVNVGDSNPCRDTNSLGSSGAGWVGHNIPMENIQRFLNKQLAAIKRTDPKVLRTVGSWSERSQTDQFGYRNYYTDTCLISGGGDSLGTMDFYQMHTYAWNGAYSSSSPLNNGNFFYSLDKPNVIGEFSQEGGDGRTIESQMNHAYYQGYAGAWTWQANGGGEGSDDFQTQGRGLNWLRGRNDQNAGGRININLN